MVTQKKKIGNFGEKLAEKFFEKKGYQVIKKNWSVPEGEIDLICQKDKEILFVEVKTRTKKGYGWAEDSVDENKLKRINAAIDEFLMQNPKYDEYSPSLDILVIEIFDLIPKFVHYENVEL